MVSRVNPAVTVIPSTRVPISSGNGIVEETWYRFFGNLWTLAGSGSNSSSLLAIQQGPANGAGGNPHAPNFAYGSFALTTDQYAGVANTAYPIEFDTTLVGDGVGYENRTAIFTASISSTTLTVTSISGGGIMYPGMTITVGASTGTRITRQLTGPTGDTGTYELSVSQTVSSMTMTAVSASLMRVYQTGVYTVSPRLVLSNTSATNRYIDVWLRVNGVDVANSNTSTAVLVDDGANDGYTTICPVTPVAANCGDVLEVMWCTSNLSAVVSAIAARTSPVRPVTPSALVTVSMVSVPTLQSVAA